jgi:integrase
VTVYRRDGKRRVQVDVGNDPITGQRKREPGGAYRTKREALAVEARMKAERERGLLGITTRSSVAEFLEFWLGVKAAQGGSPTTRADREHLTRRYIIPALGEIPLAKLTPAQAEAFLFRMLREGSLRGRGGLSTSRVRAMHQVLASAFKYAIKKGFVTRNIMEAAERPRLEERKIALWSTTQIDRFLAAVEDDPWRALYWLAIFGGLRRAELLGLYWSDVHLAEGYLLVDDTRVAVIGALEGHEKGPKSAAGRRVVTLGPGTVEALRRHLTAQREMQMEHRLVWQDRDLVFCREDGRACYPTSPTQRFLKLIERLGLPHIRFHDLRKIAGSLANVASQGDARSVSERLGHSRVDTSLQIYVRGLVERQRAIAEGMELLVRRQG